MLTEFSNKRIDTVDLLDADGLPKTNVEASTRGFFSLRLADGKEILMLSLGDCQVVKTFIKNGMNGFEHTSLNIWAALAKVSRAALDVGAYTGIYSLLASAENPRIKIIAFEPHPTTFGRLITNIVANGADGNIAPLNYGASSRSGKLNLLLQGGVYVMSSGESFEARNHVRTKDVPTVSVDEIVLNWREFHPNELTLAMDDRPIDIVKIDVEGHEKNVLKGMKSVIARDAPTMLIEILNEGDLPSVSEMLPGYKAWWVREDGGLGTQRRPQDLNVLFIHESRRDHFSTLSNTLSLNFP